MLVLSRREKEKVKFPTLGITVEVVRTGSNKVQLGIDAPREIRVIRDELDEFTDPLIQPLCQTQRLELQQQLDAVSMAIHLAQNQLRQGLETRADEALEQAISILNLLESEFKDSDVELSRNDGCCIRELRASYQSENRTLTEIMDAWFRTCFG